MINKQEFNDITTSFKSIYPSPYEMIANIKLPAKLSRGEYINLQEIVRNGGDIAKSKSQMSRRKDFNQKDFNKAVEVYNETR